MTDLLHPPQWAMALAGWGVLVRVVIAVVVFIVRAASKIR